MEKYLRFHLNLGKLNGKQVVPEKVMLWMRKKAIHMNFDGIESVNTFAYGLGLMLASYRGTEYIHHGGRLPPYWTLLSWFPEHNLGIFTSSNQGPLRIDPTVLHLFILETLKGSESSLEAAAKIRDELKLRDLNALHKRDKKLQKLLKESREAHGEYDRKGSAKFIGTYGSGVSG